MICSKPSTQADLLAIEQQAILHLKQRDIAGLADLV